MNYITHLTGFFRRVARDKRFNPTHVSLYTALFQQWNLNRFRNPISVARSEVMGISRICSRVTYHKCIRELHAWGYIHYDPSYNHFRGSLVYMLEFKDEPGKEKAARRDNFCSGAVPELDGDCTGAVQELGPSVNSINLLKSPNEREGAHVPGCEEEQGAPEGARKENDGAAKEKKGPGSVPPTLEAVRAFFLSEAYPEQEALRFFHHYSANGWLLGKAPIQDWQAAARKWMLHTFNRNTYALYQENHAAATGPGGAGGSKDYAEPL